MEEANQWAEQMVFHGEGNRERAKNWTQEFRERWVDGVRYLNIQQTIYVSGAFGVLATRFWQALPDYVKLEKRTTKRRKTGRKRRNNEQAETK